jgi:hypothetical protein
MAFNKLKPTSDDDYQAYSNYIAKLAAAAAPNDPPVTPFRIWFLWRHGAFPADVLIGNAPSSTAA